MDPLQMTLDDWLDDLCARFINCLPRSELSDFARIGLHVEEAHWFYEDFIHPQNPTGLPRLSLKAFSLRIFQHSPLTNELPPQSLSAAFDNFIAYKKRIPVRGLIMLNEAMDQAVLVKGWNKGASWSFPRGKINQAEDDLKCAIREVYEETGFDVEKAGLVPENRSVKYFEHIIREQHLRYYVIPSVPMDYKFAPRTRKEISDIRWYKLADLPGRSKKKQEQNSNAAATNASRFYMVAPFIEPLNRWVKQQLKRKDRLRHSHKPGSIVQAETEEVMTEEEGMATETGAENSSLYATVESREAATREIQRLLKIQPLAQRSQAGVYDQAQERGNTLLAMLQQESTSMGASPATTQPGAQMPHTPMDHVYNVAPEPHTPYHHHPTQRFAFGGQQAPPHFPIQPDMSNQLRSILGVANNSRGPVMQQQTQPTSQRPPMAMAPNHVNRPPLVHPQPLPRQANHILTGAVLPTPGPDNRIGHVSQQANMNGAASSAALPQHTMPNVRQPQVLNGTQLALLNVLKKESGSEKGPSSQTLSPQQRVAEARRPSQQLSQSLAALASTYGPQTTAQANDRADGLMQANGSPQVDSAQAAFVPTKVSDTQRTALLDILKQPSSSSPRRQEAVLNFKENQSPNLPIQATMQQERTGFSFGPGTIPSATQANNASIQANRGLNLPYGAQSLVARHQNRDDSEYAPNTASVPAVNGIRAESKIQIMQNPNRLPQNHLDNSLPYSPSAQSGVPVPPVGTIPNIAPRRQEADPQQLQKLMSLFSKPPAPTGGKEPATFNMGQLAGQLPTPGSHVASLGAPPVMGGAGSATSMSRGGSQHAAPISPENEKFLLNYLNQTVSSSAK
ncbi:mRNA decapping complex subunit 2 [Cytospora mali]|uniref:mRNA decapping complex subunit 2 n=1 Tax=Cytospora mali TaxID=578113 RepID=A0A194V9N9_CYTMA|nr:mRNA decapping complex subunit 2 [Valsa mali var. pyri (nom. inval.)]